MRSLLGRGEGEAGTHERGRREVTKGKTETAVDAKGRQRPRSWRSMCPADMVSPACLFSVHSAWIPLDLSTSVSLSGVFAIRLHVLCAPGLQARWFFLVFRIGRLSFGPFLLSVFFALSLPEGNTTIKEGTSPQKRWDSTSSGELPIPLFFASWSADFGRLYRRSCAFFVPLSGTGSRTYIQEGPSGCFGLQNLCE